MWFRKKKNIIAIRETLDWGNATYEDLRDETIKDAAKFWDSVFSISYMDCRKRIKAIASQAHRSIAEKETTLLHQLDIKGLDDQDIILICDDDDWYHPNVFTTLRLEKIKGCDALIWHDSIYGYFINRDAENERYFEPWLDNIRIRRTDDHSLFSPVKTNNYAVSGHYLRVKNQDLNDITGHNDAKTELLYRENRQIIHLDKVFSMVNRHPCSYVVLTNHLNWDPSPEGLINLVSRYADTELQDDLDPALRWALPYIRASKKVFKEVYHSVREPAYA